MKKMVASAATAASLLALALTPALSGVPASAAPLASVQVAVTGSANPGTQGAKAPSCPAGMVAIAAGVGAGGSDLFISSMFPFTSAGALVSAPDGDLGAPTGWDATLSNLGTAAEGFGVSVTCVPAGSAMANVHVVAAHRAVAAGTFASLGVSCPAGQAAVAGGVAVSNTVQVGIVDAMPSNFSGNPTPLAGGAGTFGAPAGWFADVQNISASSQTFAVAAICAQQPVSESTVVVVGNVNAGGSALPSATCPAGTQALSAGVQTSSNLVAERLVSPYDSSSASSISPTLTGQFPATSRWDAFVVSADTKAAQVAIAVVCFGGPKPIVRLAGSDRIATSIAVSIDSFPVTASAQAVVLARSDQFADALAGTPLAVFAHGPLLLTPPTALDARVQGEITRVLPPGATVYLLGGPQALDPSVESTLTGLGFKTVRLAGSDRFGTAIAIAGAPPMTGVSKVLEATGLNFPDALAAGAAAAHITALVLLTNGTAQAPATSAFLLAHPGMVRWAVGGQAAVADPGATAIAGTDRYDTAAKVATMFFSSPTTFGAANGTTFADALPGGAHIGRLGGPLLLVGPTPPVPAPAAVVLGADGTSLVGVYLYGGSSVVTDSVAAGLATAVSK